MADNPYNNIYADNNSYNNPYQNPYQGNPYQSPYQNPMVPEDEERGHEFNIMEWVMRILHYWYLFLISILVAFSFAFLKNRKWIPMQMSSCTLIIKESNPYGTNQNSALMQGFGVGTGYSNVNNQMIMLGSYDLTARVVDSLPFLNVEYITRGRFKTRNLYRTSPIIVDYRELSPNVYNYYFRVDFLNDGSMHIETDEENPQVSMDIRYGEPIHCQFFTGVIWPTENMVQSGHIFFRFCERGAIVDDFLSRLTLNFVTDGSTVLRISLVGDTPDRDCEFLDKLQDVYLLQNLERKNRVAENSLQFIDKQLNDLQSQLSVSEGAITDFRQENKFSDVSSYAGTLMGRLADYDQEGLNFRLKETYLNYLDHYLSQQIEQGAVVAPASLGVTEPMLTQFVTQLNELQLQRSQLTKKNAYYAKYTNDIEHVKEGLGEVIKTLRASLEIEKQELQKRYDELDKEMQKLPAKELEMIGIERNYRIDDTYYTFFLQKRAEASIQKASNTPDNEIMDRARVSVTTNADAKSKTMTTYLIIGFLAPLVLIVLSELLNDKVRSPKEASKLGPFRLIGALSHCHNQNPIHVKVNPRSRYAEMLRSIRTRIEFIVQRKTGISITVTSTESGDGKTFMATNLAALYAMTGKKTILVDLDIRKPNIHDKLGLENGVGMTNYLIEEATLDEVILKDIPFDFHVIRAGTVPPNPGELVHSDRLTELLEKLRKEYDYIIVDTSPVGQVPDAYSIIEQTDTTLFAVRCVKTSKSACRQTLEQLAIDHSEKIQLVLTDLPSEGFHHGFNYSYANSYGIRTGYGYSKYGYSYGYGGYGGGSSYGSKYGYGYGYGDEKKKSKSGNWRYRYGLYYGRMRKTEKKQPKKYYMDDDV